MGQNALTRYFAKNSAKPKLNGTLRKKLLLNFYRRAVAEEALRSLCIRRAERLIQHVAGAIGTLAAAGRDPCHARQIAHRASAILHGFVDGFFINAVTNANDHG